MEKLYLGVDIGGTKNAVTVADKNLNILDKAKFKSGRDIEPHLLIEELLSCCEEMIKKYKDYEITSLGISCGGPLDDKKGVIYSPPNLPLWDAVPIKEIFEKRLNLSVQLKNDADACALAEWKFGNGKGCRNFIFLTFGTGLGAGLILNGQLYSGTNGMAGEAGHIRLEDDGPVGYNKKGSFEGFCSGGGIKNLSQIIIRKKWEEGEKVSFCKNEEELKNIDAKKIFEEAANRDETASLIVNTCAEHLGKGLSILIDILNPERIVLGGIYMRGESLLKERALKIIEKEALSESRKVCTILPAGLGERIGDVASLTIAIMNDEEK